MTRRRSTYVRPNVFRAFLYRLTRRQIGATR